MAHRLVYTVSTSHYCACKRFCIVRLQGRKSLCYPGFLTTYLSSSGYHTGLYAICSDQNNFEARCEGTPSYDWSFRQSDSGGNCCCNAGSLLRNYCSHRIRHHPRSYLHHPRSCLHLHIYCILRRFNYCNYWSWR